MRILCLLFLFIWFKPNLAQTDSTKMQWFKDAKLGIFIHWGIYAVEGTTESWAFYNKQVPYDNYMRQIKGFKAENYQAAEWAKLIKESGAKYCVITAKHHDGVALYDTKMNGLSIPKKSPSKRDVLSPFVQALKNEQLKVGIYYSLIDWSHPDYPGFTKDSSRYIISNEPLRWQKFTKFLHGQIQELSVAYQPDLWWFDGDWEHSAQEWQAKEIREGILKAKPSAIINGRLQGYGDYATPEQNFPVSKPTEEAWELCMTINDNWGYRSIDTNYKTAYELISIFSDCIGFGGNLLLDIAPKADGTFPDTQKFLIKELGKWTHKHAEAVYATTAGLPQGHYYGASTLSKDSMSLYLFVNNSHAKSVYVKGLKNKIVKAEIVGTTEEIKPKIVGKIYWSSVPGLVYLDIPQTAQDEYITVVKLSLDKPLQLYSGKGGL